ADALKDPKVVLHLIPVYSTMAWSGRPEALEFLKQRASFEYWATHPMPQTERLQTETHERLPVTAQSQVLYPIARCPSPEAEAFLKACERDPRYEKESYLLDSVNGAISGRSSWLSYYQMAEDAWKQRGPLVSLTEEPAPRSVESYNPYHYESGLY